MDPNGERAELAQFETMIHAQLSSQLHHSRMRVRAREREEEAAASVPTTDPGVASRALHQAGALKNYKPDRVLANANLDSLSTVQLELMLRQQHAIQSNAQLLSALPDGGAKVAAQVAAIEAQLESRRARDESQMQEVERMLDQVNIAAPVSTADTKEGVMDSSVTQTQQQPQAQQGGRDALSAASSATELATSASAPSSADATMSSGAGGASNGSSRAPTTASSSSASIGRGSSAAAAHCASDVFNARIQRDNRANIQSKFRRAPPSVLSAEEATRLMQVKADDWNADAISFGAGAGGNGGGGARSHQAAGERESRAAGADSDDDDDAEFDISDDDFDRVDDDQLPD